MKANPLNQKAWLGFEKKALQFTTDSIASGADDCIYLLKLYKSEKKNWRSEENALNKTETKNNYAMQYWPPIEC